MLLIPRFSRRESELMRSFTHQQTIAQSLHSSFSRLLIVGAQHSLAHSKTERMYVLHICSCVVYKRAPEVNIGKSSRNFPHADGTLMVKLRSQPPPAPIVSCYQGNKTNQWHPVFYLGRINIRYKVSHQLYEKYRCICYSGYRVWF